MFTNFCCPLLLLALAANAQPTKPQGSQTISVNGKKLTLSYEVFKTNEKLSDASKELLRRMGVASTGQAGGGFVQVKVSDGRSASGWIDAAANLKSAICVAGDPFFVEQRAAGFVPASGRFQDVTKSAGYQGKQVSATYSMFSGSGLLAESKKLLAYAGIGIQGETSRVRLKLRDGNSGIGSVDAKGGLSILSTSGWKEPAP